MKRTFDPTKGLNGESLRALRSDLNGLLADYAGSDFTLTTGTITYDQEGLNATIKVEIALKKDGAVVTREMLSYERHAKQLGVEVALGVAVNITGIGEGKFVGYNRRATRYPFLFTVTAPQSHKTKSGNTYKLTIAQARAATAVSA